MKAIISHYIRPYFGQMGMGMIIKFVGSIMDLFIPYLLAYIIDAVIPSGERGRLFLCGFGMLLCSALALSFNMIANRKASRVASDITKTLRHDLFQRIMGLSARQTDQFTKPSLISRMTSDTYELQQTIARIQRMGVRAPILMAGGMVITFTLDPAMALVLLAVLPLLLALAVFVSRLGIPIYTRQQTLADRMVRVVREDIAGIRVIKALSKTRYETDKFRQVNREVMEQEQRAGIIMAVMDPAMSILLNLGLVGVILTGAVRVNAGKSEVGRILAFTTYFTIILNAMMAITRFFPMISRSIASGNRIWAVLESEEEMEVVPEPEKMEEERESAGSSKEETAQIEFSHVSFSYKKRDGGRPQRETVSDISFRVNKGETLGIIGEIGSGKSTILSLLLRLYDRDQGKIEISGRDVRSYSPEELKEKFGVVFQNDMIFEDTIAENVSLGRSIAPEQLQEALLYAQASEFVEGRADQDQEALSIRGANLSGGQKQRVLIARALAARPEILVLDDSSSALDYRTDAKLRQSIREHFSDTTLVIVAQRVSSIRHADHILVLEEGREIGLGTHEELMHSCAVYREICLSQMGEEICEEAGEGEGES